MLLLVREGGRTIAQGHHVVAILIPRPDSTFHAAVRKKAGDSDGLDSVVSKYKVQACTGEPVEAALALYEDVSGITRDCACDLGTPGSCAKCLTFCDAFEDAIGLRRQLRVTVGEKDRQVDYLYTQLSRLFDGKCRVRKHIGLFHNAFYCVMENATGGRKVILIFNQYNRSFVGVHNGSRSWDIPWRCR